MVKINELILQQLGEVITREVEMPDVFVTITRVTTSKDLHYSTIYISVLPDEKLGYAVKKLNSASKHLRYELNKKVVLRIIPRLEFRPDTSGREAADIDALLDSLKDTE
jgi:ribosome-binding factor A